MTNFSNADLSGEYLSGADLSDADLSGADLSRADFSDANFSRAYLRDANLRGANLSGADLIGADLSAADLSGAYLIGADFSAANLRDANLSGADLSGANLRGADLGDADVPVIPHIDATILAAIEVPGAELEMGMWHTCETTHCRAGWAIHLAGEAGYALEKRLGSSAAGALIYTASGSHPVPEWNVTDDDALEDLRLRAQKSGR